VIDLSNEKELFETCNCNIIHEDIVEKVKNAIPDEGK